MEGRGIGNRKKNVGNEMSAKESISIVKIEIKKLKLMRQHMQHHEFIIIYVIIFHF